jgi:hypothetical protein
MRLDLRQVGDVVDPPTLPQCTKCRFPLFSDRLTEQAKDPAKAHAFKQLGSFVRGADFQMLASKNPSYFALAQVQQILKAPPPPYRAQLPARLVAGRGSRSPAPPAPGKCSRALHRSAH